MRVARVLMADDTKMARQAIRAAFVANAQNFESRGLRVVSRTTGPDTETSFRPAATAPSAEAEIAESIKNGQPFDFAVIDLLFDAADVGARTGLATLRVLRRDSPDTKVIVNATMSENFGRRLALVAALAAYEPHGIRWKEGIGASSLEQVIYSVLVGTPPNDISSSMPAYAPDGSKVDAGASARSWLKYVFTGEAGEGELSDFRMPVWRQRWECMSPDIFSELSDPNVIAERINPLLIADGVPPILMNHEKRRGNGFSLSPTQQTRFYMTQLDRLRRFEEELGWDGKEAPKGPASRKYSEQGSREWPRPQVAFSSVAEAYSLVLRPGTYSREFMLALAKIFGEER